MDKIFRLFPSFRGKLRIARLLLAKSIKNKKDIEVSGKYGCRYLLPNLIENVGFDIYVNGQYEPEIHELLFRLLPKNGSFLDLGANIGTTVVPLCKRRPDISAVSVEAAPWIFAYLRKNVELNHLNNVKLVNKALFTEDDKEMDFFSPEDKYGKGSLSPVFTNKKVTVTTRRLDTLLQELKITRVDLIKVDVEGFEYFVFEGGKHLLSPANAPVIVFEFIDWAEKQAMGLQPGDAQKFLRSMGYILYEVVGDKLLKQQQNYTAGSYNLVASKSPLGFA